MDKVELSDIIASSRIGHSNQQALSV
jgi:hypothetical protein